MACSEALLHCRRCALPARLIQPLTAIDRTLTWIVATGTFVLRWLTLDFDNDYFMHMAWAADMLRGMAEADVLIALPEGACELDAGAIVDILPLPGIC